MATAQYSGIILHRIRKIETRLFSKVITVIYLDNMFLNNSQLILLSGEVYVPIWGSFCFRVQS